MEVYKAEQEAYVRSENIDHLNRQVFNLQFANGRIYQELLSKKKLCDVLMARLSKYNEPPEVPEYSTEDLRMLKSMGIAP